MTKLAPRTDPEVLACALQSLQEKLPRHTGLVYCCVRHRHQRTEYISFHTIWNGRLKNLTLEVAAVLGETVYPCGGIRIEVPRSYSGRCELTGRLCQVLFDSPHGLSCEGI